MSYETNIKPRRKQANYLEFVDNTGATCVELLNLGFSSLNEEPGAQTTSKRYIGDASASKIISGYEPVFSYTADQIRSEKAIDHIVRVGELRKTGSDTNAILYMVDLDQPTTAGSTVYHARKQQVSIEVSTLGDEDGNMTAEGSLNGIGDIIEGFFETANPDENSFTTTITPTNPPTNP